MSRDVMQSDKGAGKACAWAGCERVANERVLNRKSGRSWWYCQLHARQEREYQEMTRGKG